MREKTIERIRLGWKIQTLQFEYPSHAKQEVVLWHFVIVILSLLLCYVHKYFGFGVIPCMISWNYLFLFDKKRKAYRDSYVPKRYEYVGTIFATIIFTNFLLHMIFL